MTYWAAPKVEKEDCIVLMMFRTLVNREASDEVRQPDCKFWAYQLATGRGSRAQSVGVPMCLSHLLKNQYY